MRPEIPEREVRNEDGSSSIDGRWPRGVADGCLGADNDDKHLRADNHDNDSGFRDDDEHAPRSPDLSAVRNGACWVSVSVRRRRGSAGDEDAGR